MAFTADRIKDDLEHTRESLKKVKAEKGDKLSRAKRIQQLMYQTKSWRGNKQKLTSFKEPTMFFQRRTGLVEWYENVTSGIFEYTHSDGQEKYIIINPRDQMRFGYGDTGFKGYIAHEDHPTTGKQEPLIVVDQMNTIIEKSLQDMRKYKAQEMKFKGKWMLWLGLGIAAIIGAIALLFTLVPNIGQRTAQTTAETAIVVVQNLTPTVVG